MHISDLLPWRRKDKTKVPVRVEDRPVQARQHDALCPSEDLSQWLGLAPVGAFGGWADLLGPRMDMAEHSTGFKVSIEVPGMEKDDLNITLSEGRLIVRGEKQDGDEHRGRKTYQTQSTRRAFRRSVLLPCQIDAWAV